MRAYWRRGRESMPVTIICAVLLTTSVLLLPTGSTESNDESGTLRIGVLSDTDDFNIFNLASDSVWKHTILGWSFESIAAIDYDSRPIPFLAESWTFDEYTLTVDIDLREGVLFHDGTEMTADDVHFSYLMARDGTTYSSMITSAFDSDNDNIVSEAELNAGVQIIDDYRVRMVMAQPYVQFFSNTLTVPILPKHIWQDHVDYANRVDVTWGSDLVAAIGTGPFFYAGGVPNDFRVLDKNTDYWGQSYVTPAGYRLYPPNVDRLHFSVKPSVDSAISALRSGELDHIASSIPTDWLPLMDSDPSITVDYLDDAGYFYLGFNMKKEPMNNISFRKAVSHLIDKAHVVDAYMGGLGKVGTTAVSPYFGEWHNEAVVDYVYDDPEDPLTTIPEDILDDAGFLDSDGDGWRNLPDGTPMEKLIILAPPADYDPIRVRTAEMIAGNLVKVGINAEALAVDFNTIVGKLVTFDYQMVVIGWNFGGYSECVSVLFDIYGASAASNNCAFWSDANPSPFYSDLGGVSTLADERTMELVDEFAELEDVARATFDVVEQVDYVRQGQAIIADAVPCNILYYRVNAMATSTEWTGWTPYMGTLLNMFSLSELSGVGVDRMYQDASQGVNVGLSAPKTLVLDDALTGHVQVIDNMGDVVPDVDVAVIFEPLSPAVMDVMITPSSGTTDTNGLFWFTISGATEGSGVLTAIADDGVTADEDSMILSLSPALPTTLILSASIESAVVSTGESVDISVKVQDEHEMPVQGAAVSIDEPLICCGTVTPTTVFTDASGLATMTYSAPPIPLDPDSHLLERLLFSVSKSGYQYSSTAYLELLVYNDAPPDWVVMKITDVTTTALSSENSVATVTVQAADDEGNALTDTPLAVEWSDESYVSAPVTEVTTDIDGFASFEVEAAGGAPTGAFKVAVREPSMSSSVAASITFTHVGAEAPAYEMYGGYITYDEATQFMPALGTLHATAHIWDSSGDPAEGKAALVLPTTMEGMFVDSPLAEWNSLYDYMGIEVTTSADGFCRSTSGPFSVPDLIVGEMDPWIPPMTMEGVDMVAGEIGITLFGVDVALSDLLGGIIIVPDAAGYFDWTTFNYMIEGQTSIVGEYAYGRSYEVLSASHEVDSPMMLALTESYDTTSVTVTVTDQDRNPVEGADVTIYQMGTYVADYGVLEYGPDIWSPGSVQTDAEGTAEFTVLAVGEGYAVTDSFVAADVYVVPSGWSGAISLPSQSYLFICPQKSNIEGVPITTPVSLGGYFAAEAYVSNLSSISMVDMTVDMFAGTDDTVTGEELTDIDGLATFPIDTSGVIASEGGFIPVTFSTSGPGYDYSAARLMVPVKNHRPVITVSEPAEGEVLPETTVTITGLVSDSNGVAAVTISVDNGTPYAVPIVVGDSSVTFELTVYDLVDGPHHVLVESVDMLQVSSAELRSFIVSTPFVLERYAGSVSDSVVVMTFQPDTNGLWRATLENDGLSRATISIYDIDEGNLTYLARLKVGFQGDPDAVVETEPVSLLAEHVYLMVFLPVGPEGGSALVAPSFEAQYLTVSMTGGNI